MTIKTKFNEGDKLFTIDAKTLKVKQFQVERIMAYVSNGKTSVSLYPKGDISNSYDEDKCFPTEAELITFITTKDDAKAL